MKVKNGKQTTAMQGKYQNPWAPFGYVKSAQERGKLEVDQEAARIVRRIFEIFLEGRGTMEVARILNGDGVPTKSAYRAAQGDSMRWQYVGEINYWNTSAVRSILTDKRYIGSVVYGRQQAKGVAAHRNIKAPQGKLVEVEGCHEQLVSQEDFERAQAQLSKGQHYGKSTRPLAGKIKCGVCGHAMPLINGNEPYFVCGTKWYDSDYNCGDFRVRQAELYKMLTVALQKQIDLQVEREVLQQVEVEKRNRHQADLEQELAALHRELTQGKEKMREQFELYAVGDIGQEDFAGFQRDNKRQTAQQTQKIITIQQQMVELGKKKKNFSPASLTTPVKEAIEMLNKFVRMVRVWQGGEMEVFWEFDIQ